MENLVFAIIFVVTVGSACIVAFSRNLIYSAFALIGTFFGVAATFISLSSAFLGLAQIMVYAGGILVLTIFAVMLTARISNDAHSNPVVNYKIVVPAMILLAALLGKVVMTEMWAVQYGEVEHKATTAMIGVALLNEYLLPFGLVSIVLLMAMVGAAIITRRHVKE